MLFKDIKCSFFTCFMHVRALSSSPACVPDFGGGGVNPLLACFLPVSGGVIYDNSWY